MYRKDRPFLLLFSGLYSVALFSGYTKGSLVSNAVNILTGGPPIALMLTLFTPELYLRYRTVILNLAHLQLTFLCYSKRGVAENVEGTRRTLLPLFKITVSPFILSCTWPHTSFKAAAFHIVLNNFARITQYIGSETYVPTVPLSFFPIQLLIGCAIPLLYQFHYLKGRDQKQTDETEGYTSAFEVLPHQAPSARCQMKFEGIEPADLPADTLVQLRKLAHRKLGCLEETQRDSPGSFAEVICLEGCVLISASLQTVGPARSGSVPVLPLLSADEALAAFPPSVRTRVSHVLVDLGAPSPSKPVALLEPLLLESPSRFREDAGEARVEVALTVRFPEGSRAEDWKPFVFSSALQRELEGVAISFSSNDGVVKLSVPAPTAVDSLSIGFKRTVTAERASGGTLEVAPTALPLLLAPVYLPVLPVAVARTIARLPAPSQRGLLHDLAALFSAAQAPAASTNLAALSPVCERIAGFLERKGDRSSSVNAYDLRRTLAWLSDALGPLLEGKPAAAKPLSFDDASINLWMLQFRDADLEALFQSHSSKSKSLRLVVSLVFATLLPFAIPSVRQAELGIDFFRPYYLPFILCRFLVIAFYFVSNQRFCANQELVAFLSSVELLHTVFEILPIEYLPTSPLNRLSRAVTRFVAAGPFMAIPFRGMLLLTPLNILWVSISSRYSLQAAEFSSSGGLAIYNLGQLLTLSLVYVYDSFTRKLFAARVMSRPSPFTSSSGKLKLN